MTSANTAFCLEHQFAEVYPALEPPVHALGPLVQPTLLENWVTGVFEVGAKYPYFYTLMKSIVVVGAIGLAVVLWALVGEWTGLMEIPKARLDKSLNAVVCSIALLQSARRGLLQ